MYDMIRTWCIYFLNMLERQKQLFLGSKNISKDSYLWNMIQSILFATQSAFLLMVITRTNGLDDAGVFSIAYAIASLMYYLGEYGVRKYQVTDVAEKTSFSDYHTHRVVTCMLAVIVGALYAGKGLFTGQYSSGKAVIIIIVCAMKAIEAYCDVYFSRFQQKGRLDVASKASTYRIVLPMVFCIIALVATHDLLISMLVWLAVTVIAVLTSFVIIAPEFGKIELRTTKQQFLTITKECFPLFAGSFLLLYVGNAPKYAIDSFMDDKAQACFNFIFMPVFVIGLLANFIFNPILVKLSEEWNAGNRAAFGRIVKRQIAVIGGITLLAIAVALTIGCPVLGMLFNTDLSGNRANLTILMIGGGLLALSNFFIVVVTVVRGQKYLLLGYVSAALCAWLLSGYFVKNHGIPGACMLYAALMLLASLIFAAVLLYCTRKKASNS